ncbi:MAG: MBL fold metallo-hydrolase [Oscillospiraceae bacterium]|nr:MBL fold metallo-hydrolase [Oscillospiraceae bacterium]
MPKLLYQGHASFRLTADVSPQRAWPRVIYIDPFAGEGYDVPADLILVTHDHRDHNRIHLCAQNSGCRVITQTEALVGGQHNRLDVDGIVIEAAEAGNLMHNPQKCVGYLVTLDGVKLYFSGDTAKTKQMETFAALALDYAFFPGDGLFNMNLKEAADCARLVDAKHNGIIHLKPGALYDRKKAEKWDAPNKMALEPGREMEL